MLASLSKLNYAVEWRVINAADYGMPQRRRRVFILAYGPATPQYQALNSENDILGWIEKDGIHSQAFPIHPLGVITAVPKSIKNRENADLADISDEFNLEQTLKQKSPFMESGVMVNGRYYTYKTRPKYDGKRTTLSDILLSPEKVPLVRLYRT